VAEAIAGNRFLVVSPQGLGDSLEATSIVRALRRKFPKAHIAVATMDPGSRLLFESLDGYVDDVLYLPYWEHGMSGFLEALWATVRRKKYDASFLAYPSARNMYALLMALFPSHRRFAHRHRARSILAIPSLHSILVPVRSVHNVERNRDLLRAAGIEPDTERSYLIPPGWVADASERQANTVGIHVGSVGGSQLRQKRWPLEYFIELCKRLVVRHSVALIVGPGELEESARVLEQVPMVRAVRGSLPDVARFLSTCTAVVANDSGIAHLAAGVGAPVLTLFGPTPTEFAPFPECAIALRPSGCPPCFDVRRPVITCARDIDYMCLKSDLSVDRVWSSLESLVRQASKT
jgi:ADP-heptose:LPS heptosyltransferase